MELCSSVVYDMKIKNILYISLMLVFLASCRGAKLSVANEQFVRGEYFDAANTYRKVYNKLRSKEKRALRGEVAYQIGTCYRLINVAPRSSAAYRNAIRYNYPDSMAIFYLARELQYEGKYKEAEKYYRMFLEKAPGDVLAENGLKGCQLAQEWKNNPTRYIVKRDKLFNSSCLLYTSPSPRD